MESLSPRVKKRKTYLFSLIIKDLLKSYTYSITKIVILKNILDNVRTIEEISFSYLYIVVSLYFISMSQK